jgi:acetyl-CoA acetyltransferase family protein
LSREAVIVEAVRTPIGRRNGQLSSFHPNDLLALALKAVVDRSGVDPAVVDDVVGGCVSQVGEQSTNVTRNGWIAAGLPWHVPATTVDRQCGSSQQAVHFAAQGVLAGAYDVAVACGVEVMSRVPLASNARGGDGPFSQGFMAAVDGQLLTQFQCSQLLADKFGISREDMDEFSLQSHQRAAAATDNGKFASEIVPVALPDGSTMTADEGIRRDTSLERLAALPSAWDETTPGITAGNASQVSDGAAAMVIADRDTAERLGLPIRARFVHFAVGADDAVNVLSAPNPVTRKLLERSGMKVDEFDAIECNEAFAAIALMWATEFKPDPAEYNGWGGAIAIGHPLGASGVRLMTTLLHRLEDENGRFGFQTMCEGGGQANATVIERL